jgi:O-antigen ligase
MACALAGVVMQRRDTAVFWTIVVAVGVGLIGYCYLSGDFRLGMSGRQAQRATAVLHNPNTLGIYMLYVTFGLACLWGARPWRFLRPLVPLLAVAAAMTIVASGSRKSLACMVAFALLWFAFVYGRQLSRRLFVVVLVGAAVLVGVFFLVDVAMQDRVMGERLEQTLSGEGVAGMLGRTRTGMYVRGLRLFVYNPVAGVGLGNFAAEVEYGGYSHSDVVEVLCTTGLIGALLYLPIYVILWRRLSRIRRRSRDPGDRYQVGVYKAVIVTMFCLGLGAPLVLSVYHWFIMAGLIGWSYIVDREQGGGRPGQRPTVRMAAASRTGRP